MIRHHPSADILFDYARGALPSGMALAAACHLDACSVCNRDAAVWESLGGAFLDSTDAVALADDALARAMSRIQSAPALSKDVPPFLRRFRLPKSLLDQQIAARCWVSPRIWIAPVRLRQASFTRTYLVYAQGGTSIPEHVHVGREFTTVLHGRFRDDGGAFEAGDFTCRDGSGAHAPIIHGEGECLCLIGAERPLRFTDVSARLVQALARFSY